ncbi:MAG: hypothetical protein MHMPM18_004214 [Marteilia pararefringens]
MKQDLIYSELKVKIASKPIFMISKSYCPFCHTVKDIFNNRGLEFDCIEIDTLLADTRSFQQAMRNDVGSHTVPQIYRFGQHVGDCTEIQRLIKSNKFEEVFK